MEQLDVNGYCDLNITHKPDDQLLARLIEFDYRAIALNWTLDVSKSDTKSASKKKKGKPNIDSDIVVFPKELAQTLKTVVTKYHHKLKVFLRISIIFGTQDQLKSVLNSPDIKKYDLIAVLPTTNAAYQHACSNHSIDIISFEIGVSDYKPNGKMHKQLVDRSGYFEISYGQALKSSAKRQETFTMAQYYFIYGKSKNAIISSGAAHFLDVRNPFDVANLGILFGLSGERGKCAVSRNCHLLLLAAAGRRYGKTAITVELNSQEDEEPCIKRLKLESSSDVSEVTNSISSLTKVEGKQS